MPDGTSWDYTPGEMAVLATLDYEYDDLSPAVAPTPPVERLSRLSRRAPSAAAPDAFEGRETVPSEKNVELVGANQEALKITGEARTSVQMHPAARRRVSASLDAAAETAAPDRVFLNLENVRGLADATAFQVYVSAPGAAGAEPVEQLAGSVALFGVRKATMAEGPHAGQGLTFVLEITKIIDDLHLSNALDVDALDVRIVPVRPVADEAQVTVGRVSIFRQGR